MKWILEHPAYLTISIVGSVASIASLALGSRLGFLVIAVLAVVAVGVVYRYHRAEVRTERNVIPTEERAESSHEPTKQWMDCRYCDGTGSVVTYATLYDKRVATCGVCSGHGQILTDLWSQPDCRRCGGSGKLKSEEYRRIYRVRQYSSHTQPCDVCGGTGKRPR